VPRKKKDNKLVRIGPIFASIHEIKDLADADGVAAYGLWFNALQEIRLLKGMTSQLCFATLIHEILHAINDLYDLRLSEKQICILESAWAQVLIDNNLYKLSGVVK
jgi:hypothetical protein